MFFIYLLNTDLAWALKRVNNINSLASAEPDAANMLMIDNEVLSPVIADLLNKVKPFVRMYTKAEKMAVLELCQQLKTNFIAEGVANEVCNL